MLQEILLQIGFTYCWNDLNKINRNTFIENFTFNLGIIGIRTYTKKNVQMCGMSDSAYLAKKTKSNVKHDKFQRYVTLQTESFSGNTSVLCTFPNSKNFPKNYYVIILTNILALFLQLVKSVTVTLDDV